MSYKQNNSLLSNITRVLSANFLVAIVGFIGTFIFPRILSIESYSLYHTFTLYVGYIGILHLGFPSGMVINYAGKQYDEIDKQQYKSEVLLLLVILICFTLCFLSGYLFTRDIMILYISLAIIPVCLISSYRALFQAWNKFKIYTRISTIMSTVVPVMALIYYVIYNDIPGYIYICIYLSVYWIIAITLLSDTFIKFKGVRSKKLLSEVNWKTEKIGIALMLGNYVNTVFVSADKQFIRWFFGDIEFAFYSFGMSMQALMTVFITSVAQPLFPAMAQGRFKNDDYNNIKNLLIVFGSLSGCAYFAISIIVKLFITKYIGSLEIIGIYFAVFPALAVINCLYINLYKIKGLMRKYISTLIFILMIAIILNIMFICIIGDFKGVAIATTITYYIWLIIGFRQFEFLKLKLIDIIYLLLYIIGFFVITRSMSDYVGFLVYFIFIFVLASLCYRKQLTLCINKWLYKEKTIA